ncbi:hypothetical protein D9613_002158 [Agrocybe pediades]|uniref:Mediator of RNA polymerase II transcription subunit 7 n=1 Tax=Agrocybe pediades TaxID=84607 RepID=A0A8H4R809_9AGAR|nr:hypothetical protein D9613_002158 [Agrocybe pediades]
MDDEETAELRNPFPSPPSHYTKYTSHNLNLLALLKERSPNDLNVNQSEVLKDQTDVPDWPLAQLEKPRVDWILEEPDAHYDVFGDRWFVKESILSLADLGGNQLYATDPTIGASLFFYAFYVSLILMTYSALTGSLLSPPPVSPEIPAEWQRHVEWITVLSQNLMAAANDLRPVQARGNLEMMLKRQLELRREETQKLHEKCDAMSAKLAELKASVQNTLSQNRTTRKAERRGPSTVGTTFAPMVRPLLPSAAVLDPFVDTSQDDERSTLDLSNQNSQLKVLNWAEQTFLS